MKQRITERGALGMELFNEGYNCAQSSFLAFNELVPIEFDLAAKLSSSFGGGMGRMREVCGALTGIFMIAGILYGYDDKNATDEKAKHYERIQFLSNRFKENTECNSYICRDLLHLDIEGADSPVPAKRDENYYGVRPCANLVAIAVSILDDYIKEHPYNRY